MSIDNASDARTGVNELNNLSDQSLEMLAELTEFIDTKVIGYFASIEATPPEGATAASPVLANMTELVGQLKNECEALALAIAEL
jgi:hypothetical protein